MEFKPGTRVFLFCLVLTMAGPVLGTLHASESLPPHPLVSAREEPLSPRIRDLLHYRSAPLRNDGGTTLQKRRLAGEKAPASLNAVVVMCDFSDSLMFGRYGLVEGDFPPPMQSEFYYDAHDSIYFDHLLQDVADFYADVSAGDFTLNVRIHPRTINLPHPMGFYGNHPVAGEQPVLLARDVVDSLDAEIDFSLFDTLILIHAGAGEETDILGNSPEQIYSNYLDTRDFEAAVEDSLLDNPWLPSVDFPEGQGIDRVLVLPETEYQDPIGGFGGFFGSLGVYCFEVGLRLGMLSLSDFTPGGNPDSQGIGEFGLMGYGLFVGMGWIPPHPCAFNKLFMGWLEPGEIDPLNAADLVLTPCERTDDPDACLRVNISGQEYWLLAYRLQDPDGNRIFSFPGDLNLNGIPDFYDADSPTGDGVPPWGETFDPETDTRERLLGCEWDFFMSENNARGPYEKGAGSGVYIWHVDEGVIQDVFDAETNLFNADPRHKSVDLEEADSIQDLDSREPSDYMLGGDDDSFRGEGAAVFGPATLPNTQTNGGADTGITFADFSNVVLDSMLYLIGVDDSMTPPFSLWAFSYADTLRFNLSTAATAGPVLGARRTLPLGEDLTGSHVLMADLDLSGDSQEIILTGTHGNIFVLDGDLNEFLDRDTDPDSFAPFARGIQNNAPVFWNQPAAVGDLDHDGEPEIVLTGPGGIFAFNADASPVLDLDPQGEGLYRALEDCRLPAVLVPADFDGSYTPGEAVDICVQEVVAGVSQLSLYAGAAGDLVVQFPLGNFEMTAPPVWVWQRLVVSLADTVNGVYGIRMIDPAAVPDPAGDPFFPVSIKPGPHPLLAGLVDPADPEGSLRYLIVTGADGQGETVVLDGDGRTAMENILWPGSVVVSSGMSPGGAFVVPDGLGRAGHNGGWLDGWPVSVPGAGVAAATREAAGSLVARLVDSDLLLDQYILPSLGGRIFALGTQGELPSGWPLSGPARCIATPGLGWTDRSGQLDLVSVGTFERIVGLNEGVGNLGTGPLTTITLFEAVADSGASWPMWGGSPWRNGNWDMSGQTALPGSAEGTGIVSGSHKCYPSPLVSGPLYVRGSLRSPGRVHTVVYNLEGEEIFHSPWQPVSARDPFVIPVDLEGVVTGLYLCRLVAETDGGTMDVSLRQFAVVR